MVITWKPFEKPDFESINQTNPSQAQDVFQIQSEILHLKIELYLLIILLTNTLAIQWQ